MRLLGFSLRILFVALSIPLEKLFQSRQVLAKIFGPAVVNSVFTEQFELERDTRPTAGSLCENGSADSRNREGGLAVRVLPHLLGRMSSSLPYSKAPATLQTKVCHNRALIKSNWSPTADPLTQRRIEVVFRL